MNDNPYAPPLAVAQGDATRLRDTRAGAVRRIRIAVAGVMLYVACEIVLALRGGETADTASLAMAIPGILLLLGIGVLFRSRACAILQLAVAVPPRLAVVVRLGGGAITVPWLLLVAACVLAGHSTFEYQARR